MNEGVLKALMDLFAILANVNEQGDTSNDRSILYEYLHRQFSTELVHKYLHYFDEHVQLFNPYVEFWDKDAMVRRDAHKTDNLLGLCEQLNEELRKDQKILVIIHLLDFIYQTEAVSELQVLLMDKAAELLLIEQTEYREILHFTLNQLDKISQKENLLSISSSIKKEETKVKHMVIDKMVGRFNVLRIKSTNTFVFRYQGDDHNTINGHTIRPYRSYVWFVGSVIKNPRFGSIYYTWMVGRFIEDSARQKFVFTAKNVEYAYGNTDNGLKRFTLNEESGRLIGIIGGSGSGKSTLLKVLNGTIKPKKGSIQINGLDIHEKSEELQGVIGYVPQDDVLIKELTVYQNLYYNAKLSFGGYAEDDIREIVEQALINFDLVEARDLQVGDSINTYLSGGQRKRLNIALELIREPSILFVDEPTSGLSSADSEKVMNLLKRQTYKGKLIFSILHQPSSDTFKLLDKLLVIDQGGRVIYYGNPIEALSYFKRLNQHVDAEESECLTCGNINSDQILRNIEARMVDVNGRLARQRKTTPEEWYNHYLHYIDPKIDQIHRPHSGEVPKSYFNKPKRWDQLKVYFTRDILAKLKNRQYLIINLLEAPLLAIILAFFTRSSIHYSDTSYNYTFSENVNINAYLFMSVIVALFMGLVISAEEIFKDRKILNRERFLNLSRFSYLQSKIIILFIFSAVQALTFVIIGNYMLEIRGMWIRYFLILFSTACWASMIGLNISSGFNSVVTIYILIPLVLVPQLLLSGTVIDFNQMNPKARSVKYVPLIGDIIASRWAYESLAVTQFKDNAFQKHFYTFEENMDNAVYYRSVLVPLLLDRMNYCLDNLADNTKYTELVNNLKLLENELVKIGQTMGGSVNEIIEDLTIEKFTPNTYQTIKNYLLDFDINNRRIYQFAVDAKENEYEQMIKELGGTNKFVKFKKQYYNNQLAEVVFNEKEVREYVIYKNEVVRLKSPVYRAPLSNMGRAQYFAPYKKIGGLQIDTLYFNILFLWLFSFFFYIALYYEWLKKLIRYLEYVQLLRFSQRKLLRLIQGEKFN